MFDLRKAPVARILLPFTGGALAGNMLVFSVPMNGIVFICMIIWFLLFILFLICKMCGIWSNLVFHHLLFLLFLALGTGTGMVSRPVDPGLPVGENVVVRGEALEEPYSGRRNWVMEMRIFMVSGRDSTYSMQTNLKVYFEIPEDSILPAAGETWQLYGQLSPIKNSGNPGEPDYEAIMQRKSCWYRFFAHSRYPVIKKVEDSLDNKVSAIRFRKIISQTWSGDPEVVSLLKAVCLGDRSGLTDDLRYSYTAAGGMHLLAVSGLHVGLIWWVLQHSLAWMVRLFRSEIYRAFVIIALLWFYAYVTGFSSSVSRSVTMFTFFTVSRLIDQRTHPVNGILVSAFFLILINPAKLLDVGFQLSYAAILGIVTIFPKLRSLVRPKNRILKWIYEATMVSLAAQLSTAPLVIYYFHQLPAYSLLTNIFAIPLLSCLIAIFVISIPFVVSGMFVGLFNGLLLQLGSLMNRFMEFVASIPGALIRDLYLDRLGLIMLMVIVFLCTVLLSYRSTFPRFAIMFVISGMLVWSSWTRYIRLHTAELVVSHFSGGSLVTIREGSHVDHYTWARDKAGTTTMDRFKAVTWDKRRYDVCSTEIANNRCFGGVISFCKQASPGLWTLVNDQINGWVITGPMGKETMEMIADQQGDFILLSCEPQIRNTHLLERLVSCELIVDGSNRNWFIRQMEGFGGAIYFTSQQGAYLKRW